MKCDCGSTKDIKKVQFRNGWGKSANGYHVKIYSLCLKCRKANTGTYRIVKN